MMNRSVMQRQMFRKGGAAFPDLSGDGKITQKDILMGRGVIPTPKQYGGAVGMQQGGVAPPMMPPPAPAMMPPPPPMPPDPAMMPPPPQMDNLDPAVLEGMMGAAAEGIQSLDQAQDYEQVMNTIRGDEASIGERRDELASVVGERDADQTPESVLTLVQPVMQMAQSGVDLGIGALAQDQMAGDVQGPMAEGIMSTVDMGMEEAPPVNFNQGGPVLPMKNGGEIKYMNKGGLGGRLGDIFREKQALYESVAGTDPQALQDQKNMTQAQMLFDIANTALAFASPMPNEPMGLSGAERLALAAQGTQLFDKIGTRGQQLEAFKQAQEKDRRALSLGALQAAESQLATEKAAAAKGTATSNVESKIIPGVGLVTFNKNTGEEISRIAEGPDYQIIELNDNAVRIDKNSGEYSVLGDLGKGKEFETIKREDGSVFYVDKSDPTNVTEVFKPLPNKTVSTIEFDGNLISVTTDNNTGEVSYDTALKGKDAPNIEYITTPNGAVLAVNENKVFDKGYEPLTLVKGTEDPKLEFRTIGNTQIAINYTDPKNITVQEIFRSPEKDDVQVINDEGNIFIINKTKKTSTLVQASQRTPNIETIEFGDNLFSYNPDNGALSVLATKDTLETKVVNGKIVVVDKKNNTVKELAEFAADLPQDIRIFKLPNDNGIGSYEVYEDLNTPAGQALQAKVNYLNSLGKGRVAEILKVATEKQPTVKSFLIPDGVGPRLSYDNGKTYVDERGNIQNMHPKAIPLDPTRTYEILQSEKIKAAASEGLRQLDKEIIGVNLNKGTADNPVPVTGEEIGLVRDALQAAQKGTGFYAYLAATFDAIAGVLPFDSLRELVQDTQSARQFLEALKILGRSSLIVNNKYPVAEMQNVGSLFPNTFNPFKNPVSEANKLIELKRVVKLQQRENLRNLAEGGLQESDRSRLMSNNLEIDRLLSLIKDVPLKPISNENLNKAKDYFSEFIKN